MAKTVHFRKDYKNGLVTPMLTAVAILLPLIIFALIGLDVTLRASDQDQCAVQWMTRLDLSVPALWPAAGVPRNTAPLPAAIDLRMSPFFDWQVDRRQLPSMLPDAGTFSR